MKEAEENYSAQTTISPKIILIVINSLVYIYYEIVKLWKYEKMYNRFFINSRL